MTPPKKPDDGKSGLSPVAIAIALGASAGVWLVVDVLRRVFQ